mmetsp:Transcript_112299/g.194708  ORF Transcript_112299/g.194708 Transcript_112299/m.194708 type:complete len:82 (-) Transcript_112299:1688-1933(-)
MPPRISLVNRLAGVLLALCRGKPNVAAKLDLRDLLGLLGTGELGLLGTILRRVGRDDARVSPPFGKSDRVDVLADISTAGG